MLSCHVYCGDNALEYKDFDISKDRTMFTQEYSWGEQCFALANHYLPNTGEQLDQQFNTTYYLTYETFSKWSQDDWVGRGVIARNRHLTFCCFFVIDCSLFRRFNQCGYIALSSSNLVLRPSFVWHLPRRLWIQRGQCFFKSFDQSLCEKNGLLPRIDWSQWFRSFFSIVVVEWKGSYWFINLGSQEASRNSVWNT